jgi:hypothetical protein
MSFIGFWPINAQKEQEWKQFHISAFARAVSNDRRCAVCRRKMGKKHKFEAQWLFSLPNDLLVFLFLYLREKELCCLDSAILNHPERTLFLSVLRQRFREGSCMISILVKSWESKCRWFLRRNIPISFLLCCKTDCLEEEMISMNSSTLTTINLNGCSITHKNALALGHCSKLKSLNLKHCSLPLGFDIASIFATLTTLEDFKLDQGSFNGIAVENLSRYCSSLKFLSLSTVVGFGDDDLRCLVDGCHSLCSLTLSHVSITDESVRIILEHHRRIPTVGINFCDGVNLERISRLLRETTVPQLFGSNVKIQLAAIANFSFSIPFHHPDSTVQTIELISDDSLLVRMVEHLSSNAQLRPKVMDFIWHFCRCGGFLIIVNFGIPSILFQHLNSFDECELMGVFVILQFLLDHVNYHEYILSSGFLSIFRTRISAFMVQFFSLPYHS